MNLSDYFYPVDFEQFSNEINILGRFGLGQAIQNSTPAFLEAGWKGQGIAIVGAPAEHGVYKRKGASAPDKIRSALYKLAAAGTQRDIADLGNLKPATNLKGTLLALRDVVEYLRDMNVVTVVLGGSQELTAGICEAFITEPYFWLTTIDPVPDIRKGSESFNSTNYLTRLFKNMPNLFQYSLIGYQHHHTGNEMLAMLPETCEHLRLGILRENIRLAESVLRNSHVVSFDMGAIKWNEAPATRHKNPNGLKGEEACQLAHYAGISNTAGVFGIFGTHAANDKDGITCALAAEIAWYFINGVIQRSSPAKRTAYKVEIEGLEHPVVFLHEPLTDRWWFEVESVSGSVLEVACSHEEYRQATKNEIPARWFRFLQKMDIALK